MRKPLGLKIGLSFLGVALLLLLSMAGVAFFQAKKAADEIVKESISDLASDIGQEVERNVENAGRNIRLLAANPVIRSEHNTADEKLQEMRRIHEYYRIFRDITLLNPEGVVLTSITYDYQGEWKSKEWFQRALAGETVISPVHALLQPFRLVMIVTAPVRGEDGGIKWVLAGQINMERIWEITDGIKLNETGFLFLTDRFGNLVAFPDKQQLLRRLPDPVFARALLEGDSGTFVCRHSASGSKRICHYQILKGSQDFPGQGWRIGVSKDMKGIYLGITGIQKKILLITAVGFVLVLLLSFFLTGNIVKPVKILARAADRIAAGDLNVRVEVHTGDEIADLGEAFNRMTRDLKATTVSRDYLNNVFTTIADSLVVFDPEGRITSVNRATCELLGCAETELLGKPIGRLFAGDSAAGPPEMFGREKIISRETFYLGCGGEKIPVLFSSSAMKDREGKIICTVCSAKDIRERKQAEDSLRKSEEKFRLTFENAPDAIFWIEAETGRIINCNRSAEILLGNKRTEILEKSLAALYPPAKAKTYVQALENSLREQNGADFEAELVSAKEKIIPVHVTASLLLIEGRPVIQYVSRDVSERKRLEEEFLKAEKLASLSLLAGGIAHDFNNILMVIIGNLSLVRMRLKSDPGETTTELQEIETACFQAKELTRQLLTFAKGGPPVKNTVSVGDLVRKTVSFALRGSNVKSEFNLPGDLWTADVDAGQISQVINNLAINAQQAMPEGGVFTVTGENVNLGAGTGLSLPLAAGRYVKISFKDQGGGIPKENLSRIFEPFFTTKKTGNGLGLATSYSIIKKHDGHIRVESSAGPGTTFSIYLPASSRAVTPPPAADEIRPGQGKVLVMDDEESVQEVLGKMLKSLGYQARFSSDVAGTVETYARARDAGDPFSAVILDLVIPGSMGGEEAIARLRALDPGVKAVIASGYSGSSSPVVARYREYGFRGSVVKPFDVTTLSRILDEVIRSPRA